MQKLPDSLKNNIMDFTFLLEGERHDEVPERALCTVRMTHVDSDVLALPTSVSADWKSRCLEGMELVQTPEAGLHTRISTMMSQRFQDVVSIVGSPLRTGRATDTPKMSLPVLPELSISDEADKDESGDSIAKRDKLNRDF